jgi:hypothetical protein
MSKSLSLNTFTKGFDIRFAAIFSSIVESNPLYNVDLTDCVVTLRLYDSKDELEDGSTPLLTLSTTSGLSVAVNSRDKCEIYGRISGNVTSTWNVGSIYYRFKIVTAAGETLGGGAYDGMFRLKP